MIAEELAAFLLGFLAGWFTVAVLIAWAAFSARP